MRKKKPNVLVIAAHPDDAESCAGGTSALYVKQGCRVRFLSATNGDTGHYSMGGAQLARRRKEEAERSAAVIGAECEVLDIHNNELEPCLYYRSLLIEKIRKFNTDLIITHRLYDYHPDHRYTSQLVRDAANAAHIPNVCPLTPELGKKPVTIFSYDRFQKPVPFHPDIAVNIDPVAELKVQMWHCHTSQMYEWLPYEGGRLEEVPPTEEKRREWLARRRLKGQENIAEKYRHKLKELYGEEDGKRIRFAEVFEFSEYGSTAGGQDFNFFFPFL